MLRLLACFAVCLAAGCGAKDSSQWQIAAENKGDVPCAVSVDTGGGTFDAASVDNLEKGKTIVLLSSKPKVVVHRVKVARNKEEQIIKTDTEVPIGKKFLIVVAADGQVTTSVIDQ